jgi:hypothetical protein
MSSSGHRLRYKNAGLDARELRRRREEEGIQIRKAQREQQLTKRRNVNANMDENWDENGQNQVGYKLWILGSAETK